MEPNLNECVVCIHDFFTLSSGKRKREDHPSNYLPGGYIPQQDGAGDFSQELVQSQEVSFFSLKLSY